MAVPVVEQRARGIGILRVSDEADRGDRLGSDREQRNGIDRESDRRNIDLIDVLYERDVSGHAPLEKRPFGKAIERVERGEADVIIFAHRDRTDRSIEEGSKAIRRMDAAGGLLIAGGQVLSHQTAAQWREATFGSFLAEDYWRTSRERSMNGVVTRIIEANVIPYQLPLGILRNEDGSARPDPKLRAVVRRCFEMRARGATIRAVRAYLAEKGHNLSYRSVQIMLKSPLYVGELHWRGEVYPVLKKPIVPRHVWDAVQRMRVPSGRTAKSELLLSRQDVLRCASCGGRMVAGGAWATYGDRGGRDPTNAVRVLQVRSRRRPGLPEPGVDLGGETGGARDRARQAGLRGRQGDRVARGRGARARAGDRGARSGVGRGRGAVHAAAEGARPHEGARGGREADRRARRQARRAPAAGVSRGSRGS